MIKISRFRIFSALVLLFFFITAGLTQSAKISSEDEAVLKSITANSLRGHLSFIASDALEGRGTPSRGQEIAAEYIAAQFRRAGLEPVGDDGYFQTAKWARMESNLEGFSFTIRDGEKIIQVNPNQISFAGDQGLNLNSVDQGLNFNSAMIYKVDFANPKSLDEIKPEEFQNKILITEIPDLRREDRSKWSSMFRAQNEFLIKARALKPAFIISINRNSTTGSGPGSNRLFDTENRPKPNQALAGLIVHDPAVVKFFDALKTGESQASLTAKISPAIEKPVKLHNVIGLLRGSDPNLKDTYVMVTAHYDHLGIKPDCDAGDCIYNGANDDGSGTVSVIELASALASRTTRPKRSIIFMTVFGEERGLLGSRYYGRHPIFPIEKTIADVNLEQVGRTDDNEGNMTGKASMTGFDFSDVGEIFKKAGEATGINVFKHPQNSDAFFGRSDNQALADQGVPAHTICVAFEYPDYHGLGDHWDKIDYDNFAKTNRMVALGILMIAENPVEPKWNVSNTKTERYVKAWKEKHPGQ